MKMFGMCLNWKVIAGLAVIAVGLFVFASPAAAVAALPILLVAICPLSMLFMMKSMGNRHQEAKTQHNSSHAMNTAQSACCTPSRKLSKEEQVAELQLQLRDMQLQQERLSAQLTQLEKPMPTPEGTTVTLAKPSN